MHLYKSLGGITFPANPGKSAVCLFPERIPVVPVRHGDIEDQLLPRSGERVHGKQEHCAFFRLFAKDTGRHPYFPIQKIGDVVHMILLSLVDAGQPAGRKPNVPVGLIT